MIMGDSVIQTRSNKSFHLTNALGTRLASAKRPPNTFAGEANVIRVLFGAEGGHVPDLKCICRAKAEVEAGRAWRAKEILAGNIGNLGYSPELFEAYGEVLLATQDNVEAGRYLFLSGARKEQYAEAVTLYLGRYGGCWANLVGTFPYTARLQELKDFPESVEAHLRLLGAPEKFKNYWGNPYSHVPAQSGRSVVVEALGCGLVATLVAFLATALVLALEKSVPIALDAVHWGVWLAIGVIATGWYVKSNR